MASTQKKTTKKKKAPSKPEPPAYNGLARLIGGVVCLLLALCVLVSYFQVDALLLTFIAKVLKGTLGYGYFLAAPALLAVAVIQLRHQGRPVILRTTCTLLVPLLSGMLCHLLLCRTAYELGSGLLSQLWKDGQTLTCGGVVAGGLALGSEALLSKVVSVVVFVVLLVAALLGALHMTPQQAVDKMKEYRSSRWEDEEDEDDLEGFEPAAPRKASVPEKPVKEKPAKKRVNIDIPLDGESSAMESGEKKDFFPRRSAAVRTPDEVLDRAAAAPAVPTAPAAPAASTAPAAPAVQEAAAVKEPVSEKKKKAQVQQEVESAAQEVGQAIEQELAQGEEIYRYPPITLLEENHTDNCTEVGAELRNNSRRLADALRSFGVDATAGDVVHGPSVTRYEFTLEQGVKLSKITNLSDDIALALGASGVRVAPVPNKISVVGIEVPNRTVTAVRIRDVIESREFTRHPSPVAFAVGKDIGGSSIVGNIARLPHVLIAGTTGSGKSVCTNSLIVSILYKSTPDEVRFIMVDPKMVELAPYNGIPHLLIPVVTDPKKAAGALQWAVFEMMKRYKMFSEKGVSRIAFAVASSMESRIILDTPGAEKLVGKGDMLYSPLGDSKPTRVQGCFITPEEIERVVAFVKDTAGEAHYDQDVIEKIQQAVDAKSDKGKGAASDAPVDGEDGDELLPAAVEVVLETGQASVSMLQRRLKLGYSRAARLVDQMEERGYVGPFEGSKPRQLLITREKWQELQMAKGAAPTETPPTADRCGSIHDVFESHDALE